MCTPECIIAMLGCPAFNDAVKAVIKAGKYASQYRMFVDNLRNELCRLEDARVIIERRVHEARDCGEEIENAVTHWQADAGRMENDVRELIGQVEARMHCFACSCPNINWRYRLGKQAEEKIRDVQRLIEYKSHFQEISHPKPPPPELEFPSAEKYVLLDSRIPIFEQIVDALKDSNVKMIGVHGLGGVGKTTLVEKVAKKMLHDGTFKKIPLATVSRVLNIKEIQKKLADNLNLRLDATADEKAIAIQLWHKFKNGDKYLVILDDIWKMVDLNAIGIPITDGQIGCKVVLTSRNKDLLEINMKADRNFPIEELSEIEAWNLFQKQVGKTMKSQRVMESLAREVCQKCKGLPVAIKALGVALEDKPVYMWQTALDKLKKFMLTNIEGIDSSVWATLRVSYDMLESKDAKSCFLLCCLFAEDIDISIDDLTRHCVVRSLLSQNPRTLEEARDAIRTLVYVLKSTSLLSNGSNENVIRIHDVIRDVGISIAREEQAFLVDHGASQWPRNPVNKPSTISLNFGKIRELPDGLVYPHLHTLILDNSELSDLEVPDNFFDGMKQLTVLILARMRMLRLPSSLAKLSNLRMLCLNQCELTDIAILGDLKKNLEVLSLQGSTIEALPPEMAQLTSLRVLDLKDCDELEVIPQGIISNLTNLEELCFANTFDKWEATIDEQKDTSISKNVSVEEIMSLLNGQLTALRIHIPAVMLLPKEDLMLENLKRFRISMGYDIKWGEDFSGTRVLKYEESSLRKEFIPLVDKAEALYLRGIKSLKKVLDDRGVGNEFLDLKYLKVESCDDDFEYLLGEPKSSMQSHGLYPFNHLTDLIVKECKLNYLFSPTTARGLVHLEHLKVVSCENMEEIVGFEGQINENEVIGEVKFSKLKELKLKHLPKLISFYAEKEKTQETMGNSSTHLRSLFNDKVAFPVLEDINIWKVPMITGIWVQQPLSKPEKEAESFCKLKSIQVWKCDQLEYVSPSYMLPQLHNLLELDIRECKELEVIVSNKLKEKEATNNDILVFLPQLKTLKLWNLDNLKCFCTGTDQLLVSHKVAFPVLEVIDIWKVPMITGIWVQQPLSKLEKEVESFCKLKSITVKDCEQLEYVLRSYMLPQLHNLLRLDIEDCKELEVIVSNKLKEKEATNNDILVFVACPALEHLQICNTPSITEIWDKKPLSEPEQEIESFSKLVTIGISRCDQLVYILPSYMLPCLQNLQKLETNHCKKVEVIVSKELKEKEATDNNPIVFSQLKDVEFSNLPKLKGFYTGTQLLFSNKIILPVLEELKVEALDSIEEIWDKQPPSVNQETVSFGQLRNMAVKRCKKLMNLVPLNILPRLRNLQVLEENDSPNVEFVVFENNKEEGAVDDRTLIIPQLRGLQIWNMERLKSFYSSSTTFNAQSLFNHKVAFPALEDIDIWEVPMIRGIWPQQPLSKPEKEVESFCKLKSIEVWGCNQLEYVLPSYMLPQLHNLLKLFIRNCKELEVIVSNKLKEKEATNNDILVFPQLKTLELRELNNLKCFCTGTDQLLFSHKVAFPALEKLRMRKLPLPELWDKQPLPEPEKKPKSFYKLVSIQVEDCDQLVYVFPSYMLPQLQNLQKLVITNCKEMEVIISNKLKGKEATNNNIILLAELKTVILQILPNLKWLCFETQLGFSNKDAFPLLETNKIVVAKKESGTSSKDEDNNNHNKEEKEDREEDVKNADDNGGGEEEKDETKRKEEETEDHISNLD